MSCDLLLHNIDFKVLNKYYLIRNNFTIFIINIKNDNTVKWLTIIQVKVTTKE